MKKIETIAVHSGRFHADDVFAVAILKLIYPNLKVIRTRNEQILSQVDARVDVGMKYNPETNDFDHHQSGGAGKRKNGIPYASVGLIWKHFGEILANQREVWEDIDERIIQYIDLDDTGIDTYTAKETIPYTIADFIHGLNPHWPQKSEALYDENFEKAVSMILISLQQEIMFTKGKVKAREIIQEMIKKSNKEYLLLEEDIPWKEVVIKKSKLKYVIIPNETKSLWSILAVPISEDTFENRQDLPKAWAGLTGKELQLVTGVKDAEFCHNKLFIAVAKSKEGAIKLAELALKKD